MSSLLGGFGFALAGRGQLWDNPIVDSFHHHPSRRTAPRSKGPFLEKIFTINTVEKRERNQKNVKFNFRPPLIRSELVQTLRQTQFSELYLPDRSEASPLLAVNNDRLSVFNPDLLSHVGGLGVPLPVLLLLVNRQVLTAATAKQGLKSHTQKL